MDYQEHLKKSKDKIYLIILDEKTRHKTALELENKYHALRIAELEKVIINLDKPYPNFQITEELTEIRPSLLDTLSEELLQRSKDHDARRFPPSTD